jgi:hypothetical protein
MFTFALYKNGEWSLEQVGQNLSVVDVMKNYTSGEYQLRKQQFYIVAGEDSMAICLMANGLLEPVTTIDKPLFDSFYLEHRRFISSLSATISNP